MATDIQRVQAIYDAARNTTVSAAFIAESGEYIAYTVGMRDAYLAGTNAQKARIVLDIIRDALINMHKAGKASLQSQVVAQAAADSVEPQWAETL